MTARARSAQRVDTIDCVAWASRDAADAAAAGKPGEQVYVEGAIRRRFFRGAAGPVSRVEVEVAATLGGCRREPRPDDRTPVSASESSRSCA